MALETNRLNFTSEVDAALKSNTLSQVLTSLLSKREKAVLEVRKEMTQVLRQQWNNLLVLYQGQLDVLRSLMEDDKLRSNCNELWQDELR